MKKDLGSKKDFLTQSLSPLGKKTNNPILGSFVKQSEQQEGISRVSISCITSFVSQWHHKSLSCLENEQWRDQNDSKIIDRRICLIREEKRVFLKSNTRLYPLLSSHSELFFSIINFVLLLVVQALLSITWAITDSGTFGNELFLSREKRKGMWHPQGFCDFTF